MQTESHLGMGISRDTKSCSQASLIFYPQFAFTIQWNSAYGHLSAMDTHNVMNNSESSNRFSIDFRNPWPEVHMVARFTLWPKVHRLKTINSTVGWPSVIIQACKI